MNLDRVIAVRNNKTIYRDGDRCVKVFHNTFSKSDVLHEALSQASVEDIGLHIPKILEVTVISGNWAIVSEYIKGKTLAQLMQEHPDRTEEYLNLFTDLQLSIHAKNAPLLMNLKEKMSRNIRNANLCDAVCNKLLTRLEQMPDRNCVCHGDFNPTNVIVSDDAAYVLDWSHASIGDQAADVAQTYLLFLQNSNLSARYLDLLCEKSGIDKNHTLQWIPIIAASRLPTGNEQTRNFLKPFVSDFD